MRALKLVGEKCRLAALLGCFLTGLGWGCGGGGEATGVNVVLLTLDTTRADRLGCYGNDRIETPHLDRLAREGILFERAFTPVPSTLPSHATLLTGLHPATHGVHDNGVYVVARELETIAERLAASGYRTGAFVSAYVLDRRFGLAQGFAAYDDAMELALAERDRAALERDATLPEETRRWLLRQTEPFQRRADSVTDRALAWLGEGGPEPFFLWVHYFDPHMDYRPPPPWDGRYDPGYEGDLDGRMGTFLRLAAERGWGGPGGVPRDEVEQMIARYDGEISFMDREIGRLFAALESAGLWERTLVLAVGDHGEGFGEHGQYWEHNGQIFDEVMRVPLLLKPPGEAAAGGAGAPRRESRLVGTTDVTPTILQAAGLGGWGDLHGRPLLGRPLLGAGRPPRGSGAPPDEADGALLLEALRGRQAVATPHSWLGLRGPRHKLILHLDRQERLLKTGFYDLEADPAESRSLAEARPEETERWRRRALALHAALLRAGAGAPERGLDAESRDALEALGYLD